MTRLMRSIIIGSAVFSLWTCQPLDPPLTSQTSQTLVSYDLGARPRAIVTADLNSDKIIDVAVANSGDGTVSILVGVGDGRLCPAVGSPFPAGQEPVDVDAADLDRDGDIDLVFANHETESITVLLNNGHAHFTMAPGSPFRTGARPHIHGLATADFDGDGWIDIAVDSADTKEIRILQGDRLGFGKIVAVGLDTMPYSRLGAANVTGDENKDVLVPGHGDSTVRVVHHKGTSLAPAAWKIQLTDKPWMVVGDDVNGDQRTDIIVIQSNAVGVWLARPDGFFPVQGSTFPIQGATEVATGDIDGDNLADLVVGPWDGDEVTVLTGRELIMRKVRTCERPIGLAIADLNGDHRGELLATCMNQNRLVIVTKPVGR
ncbi:MAG: FG-GAP-like repeat-containing protein [Acidobacteriota bacterium]